MNHEKNSRPHCRSGDRESRQAAALEEKHGIRIGETIYITETTMEGEHAERP